MLKCYWVTLIEAIGAAVYLTDSGDRMHESFSNESSRNFFFISKDSQVGSMKRRKETRKLKTRRVTIMKMNTMMAMLVRERLEE